MDVGKLEKQRWNGCPTGDGRIEGIFGGTCRDGRDRTGQGRDGDEGESQIKDCQGVGRGRGGEATMERVPNRRWTG